MNQHIKICVVIYAVMIHMAFSLLAMDSQSVLQRRLDYVVSCFKKQGFFKNSQPPQQAVLMNEAIKSHLIKEGAVVWNNVVSDGNTVHCEEHHLELPCGESLFFLSHEVAHNVLQDAPLLQSRPRLGALYAGSTIVTYLGAPFFTYFMSDFLDRSKLTKVGLGVWLIAAGLANKSMYMEKDDFNSLAQKHDEIVCDVIAAYAIPGNAQNGALFFKRIMDYHGDTNGVNGNHPYTSTRIWYLQKMAKIDAFMRMTQEFKKEHD